MSTYETMEIPPASPLRGKHAPLWQALLDAQALGRGVHLPSLSRAEYDAMHQRAHRYGFALRRRALSDGGDVAWLEAKQEAKS